MRVGCQKVYTITVSAGYFNHGLPPFLALGIIPLVKEKLIKRCEWAGHEGMQKYHDAEWGVPLHDDKKLFEFLILEGAQAGLSWSTILNRRSGYKKAYDNFNVNRVAKYSDKDINRLINDSGIIRNKAKILASINNALCFIEVQKEFGSFDKYIWNCVNYKPINNKIKNIKEIPAQSKLSEEISKDLKKRGFKFVGPTIVYAHMQATGMVNDHETTCFRYRQV